MAPRCSHLKRRRPRSGAGALDRNGNQLRQRGSERMAQPMRRARSFFVALHAGDVLAVSPDSGKNPIGRNDIFTIASLSAIGIT